MILKLFRKWFSQKIRSGSFEPGEVFTYRDSYLMIVEKRYSEIAGYEYLVLLEGEIHGWITHSILEGFEKQIRCKANNETVH